MQEAPRNTVPQLAPQHVERIARACHEANRRYCQSIGDNSQPEWDAAPQWQKDSAIKGVEFHLANPGAGPSGSHESWMAEKVRTGWVYGEKKDPNATPPTHPCLVPYDQLPEAQREKDRIFIATIQHELEDTSPPTSGTFASCGRVVHVRSRFYSGPRPALVIDATYGLDRPQMVTVNVDVKRFAGGEACDGDPGTITIPLFDPLDEAQRNYVAGSVAYWAEWMPYQKGQAQKTDELTPRVAAIEEHLKNTTAFGK